MPLEGGQVVIADEKYLRDSILLPASQIAAGMFRSITHVAGRGYRDYSDQRATRGAARMVLAAADATGPAPLTLALRISDVRCSAPARAIASSRASLVPEPTEKCAVCAASPISTIGTVPSLAGAQCVQVLQITRGNLIQIAEPRRCVALVSSASPSR